MFTFQVQLTKEIYGRVSGALIVKKFLYVYILIAIIGLALVADLILVPPESIELNQFLFPVLFVAFFVAYPLLQSRFAFGWKTYPTAAQPASYVLSDQGLNVQGVSYHSFQAWENFVGVKQFKEAVVLFFTKNQIFIFPNSSFAPPELRQEVLAFVQSHIPLNRRRELRLPTVKRFAVIAGAWLAIVVVVFLALTVFKR